MNWVRELSHDETLTLEVLHHLLVDAWFARLAALGYGLDPNQHIYTL